MFRTRLSHIPSRLIHISALPPIRRIQSAAKRPSIPITRPNQSAFTAQRRHGSFWFNAQKLFRENPFSVSLAVTCILIGAGSILYANYIYQQYIVKSYHNYPEPVAVKLRRAVYYSKYDVQPKEALKYFKQALQVAEELQMDAFSDEIMGIKLEVAGMMERLGQPQRAIDVLERVRLDNMNFLETAGREKENKKRRTKVLSKTVGISAKLGELYNTPEVWDRDLAQERLIWAVEASMKERTRRINEKVTEEEEGPWISDEDLGAEMELLAHSYEAKDQHYLATPLFLQALNLYPTKDCHSVVLMSNLATSLAQQSPNAARVVQAYAQSQNVDERPTGPAATREVMIENAKTWAQKALDTASTIKASERTEECNVGCAVATHNLGEFAEMNRDFMLARQKYQEAIGLARAAGFDEGVEHSSSRLRALSHSG